MKAAQPTIAVVSQVWRGHVPAYHQGYERAFLAQGAKVVNVIFGAEDEGPQAAPAGSSGRKWLAGWLRRLDHGGLLRAFHWWRRVGRGLRDAETRAGTRVDAVFFTYLDLHLLHAWLPRWWVERQMPWRWAGIVVHPRAAYGVAGIFPGGERVLRTRSCRALVVLDPGFVPGCITAWPGKPVIVAPDLVDPAAPNAALAAARELRAWAGASKVVGLVGAISAKKNVPLFLDVARRAQAAGDDTKFIIAGELSSRVTDPDDYARHVAWLRDLPANCHAWTDRLEDGGDFNAMIAACDLLFLVYRPAPENSNVLTKAAAFHKPALVSEGHMMADAVRAFNLGEVVPAGDAAAALAAVRRLLQSGEPRDFAGYYAQHAGERLTQVAAQLIAALATP